MSLERGGNSTDIDSGFARELAALPHIPRPHTRGITLPLDASSYMVNGEIGLSYKRIGALAGGRRILRPQFVIFAESTIPIVRPRTPKDTVIFRPPSKPQQATGEVPIRFHPLRLSSAHPDVFVGPSYKLTLQARTPESMVLQVNATDKIKFEKVALETVEELTEYLKNLRARKR